MKYYTITKSYLPGTIPVAELRQALDNSTEVNAIIITKDGLFWASSDPMNAPNPEPDPLPPVSYSSDPFEGLVP